MFVLGIRTAAQIPNIVQIKQLNENGDIVILQPRESLASQLNKDYSTYFVCHDFNLKGERITVPSNSILVFQGGCFKNGTIVNCGVIDNSSNGVIFSDVCIVSPEKQNVKFSWFRYSSDSEALENAAKFGHIDCTGCWYLDKTVTINNDIEIENGDFACHYGIYNIIIEPANSQSVDYKRPIKKGSAQLPLKLNSEEAEAILIKSSDIYYQTQRTDIRNGTRGEMMLIKKKKHNKVIFHSGTICEYRNNIKIDYFKPISVSLYNCRFHSDYNNKSDKGEVLVNIVRANAEIKNCYFSGCSVGLALSDCFNSNVANCTFEKIYPWAMAFSGSTCNSTVTECTFDTNRHGWTTLGEAGVVKNCSITNNICHNSLLAICPHANAYGIIIANNTVDGSHGGVGSFAPNSIIKDNKISNLNGFPAIYLTEAGGINPIVQGNSIVNCKGYEGAILNKDVDLEEDICCVPLQFCEVNDNIINNCPDFSGITCDYSKAGAVDVTITKNVIKDVGYTAVLVKASTVKVSNNKISRVLRSNFIPISIHNTDKSSKKGKVRIEGNMINQCNSDNEIGVIGYKRVVFRLNQSDRKDVNAKFEDYTN